MTHRVFSAKLRSRLTIADLEATQYSGQSFRRGGATYAFRCGTPVELISLQGDWSSDAVLLYIAQPLEHPHCRSTFNCWFARDVIKF